MKVIPRTLQVELRKPSTPYSSKSEDFEFVWASTWIKVACVAALWGWGGLGSPSFLSHSFPVPPPSESRHAVGLKAFEGTRVLRARAAYISARSCIPPRRPLGTPSAGLRSWAVAVRLLSCPGSARARQVHRTPTRETKAWSCTPRYSTTRLQPNGTCITQTWRTQRQAALNRNMIPQHWSRRIGTRTASKGPFTHAIFGCDFYTILRTKPAPAYPARVFSRVTLRQNTAKLAEIEKKTIGMGSCANSEKIGLGL